MTVSFDERLPTPKLDDRRFQDLVDEAKRRVQQRCPEWTDHNVSDPGVTLIETFAWMTDQLLYRLNRVPDLNYIKFLELLGVTLLPPTAARANLTFRLAEPRSTTFNIPAGTQVSTERSGGAEVQITFATERRLRILPCSPHALASVDRFGVVRSDDDMQNVVCFSDRPQPGDALLVGLNQAVPSCTVRLELPCKKGAGGGIAPENAPLAWDALVGEDEGTVTLFNRRTHEELGRFTGGAGQAMRSIAFSPDSHIVASGGEGTVWLRDAHEPDRPKLRVDAHDGTVRALAFSPDGDTLASAGDDGTICLWDVHGRPEQPGRRLQGHAGAVFALAFHPDQSERTLASAGADGTVRLWDVEKGESTRRWDVHERREGATKRLADSRCVVSVAFVAKGQKLAAVGDDATLFVWDPKAPTPPGPDAQHVERRLVGHGGAVFGAAFAPDGGTVATAGADGTVQLWDLEPPVANDDNGSTGAKLEGHQGHVYGVAFSQDEKLLATFGSDWTARLWSMETLQQLQRPLSDHCPVHGVAFHPAGVMVATAGLDGGWKSSEVELDETQGLNVPGFLILHVPEEHKEAMVGETAAGWLRCRVRAHDHGQSPYDSSPVIEGRYTAETIGGTVPALNAEIVLDEVVGMSEGVPGQRFRLERGPVVPLPGNARHALLVGDDDRAWREVGTFAGGTPQRRWFMLDKVAGEIVLGPRVRERAKDGTETEHQYGAVPPKGVELRLRRYLAGGGARGNVKARKLNVLRSPIANVAGVENRAPASGGVDGEDIENAKLRGPITLRTANRAVTPEDYEQLAREAAPELARVECIPAEDDKKAGEARVLVIPKVESDNGKLRFEQLVPPAEVVNRIKRYLDERRVIGARIFVGPPNYHGITIAAKLKARREFDAKDVKARALAALYREFSPISGGRDGKGWEFGRHVLHGDIYAVLQGVRGVERVDDCRVFEANPLTGVRTALAAPGAPGEQPRKIEIPVTEYATVFSFDHYVFVKEQ